MKLLYTQDIGIIFFIIMLFNFSLETKVNIILGLISALLSTCYFGYYYLIEKGAIK